MFAHPLPTVYSTSLTLTYPRRWFHSRGCVGKAYTFTGLYKALIHPHSIRLCFGKTLIFCRYLLRVADAEPTPGARHGKTHGLRADQPGRTEERLYDSETVSQLNQGVLIYVQYLGSSSSSHADRPTLRTGTRPGWKVSRLKDGGHPGLSSHVSLQSFRLVGPGVRMYAANPSKVTVYC